MARARSVWQVNQLEISIHEKMESMFVMNFILIGFRRHFVIWDQYTFWNGQLSFQQITRFWCDVVARHRFPKRPLGSQVSFFFHKFRKKVQKSRSKSGDRMMLPPMANRFIGGSFLEQLQNHASNYQGAPGMSTPSDATRKKWLLFGRRRRRRRRRTGFVKDQTASLNVKSASRNHFLRRGYEGVDRPGAPW